MHLTDTIGPFWVGVTDTITTGYLSMGMSWEDDGKNEAYGRGANVGEWLWDLTHFKNVARFPWTERAYT